MTRPVIINGRFLAKPVGGVARVGRELLRAMESDSAAVAAASLSLALAPDVDWPPPEGQGRGFARIAGPANAVAEQALPLHHPGAAFINFCNTTPIAAARSVLWLHDAHTFDAPGSYTPAYRLWARAMFEAARLRRFALVTVSEFSKSRLVAHGADPARITVIANGADHLLRASPDAAPARAAGLEPGGYVLVLGSPAPHKNMPFALEALKAALPARLAIAAVGLAQSGPYAAQALAADPRLRLLPMLADGALRWLYQNAALVIVPSRLEGFGLFAAEAIEEAAPLLLSNAGSHPEVAGAAALYFDPADSADFCAKLEEALTASASAALRAAAAARRGHFSWSRAARETFDLIAALRNSSYL